MKIRVENIQVENEGIIVFCRTSIGDFKGIWTQKEEPLIGDDFVRFSVDYKKIKIYPYTI